MSVFVQLRNVSEGSSYAFRRNQDRLFKQELFTVKGSGNVGVGKNSPATKLDVAGGVKAEELEITSMTKVHAYRTTDMSVPLDTNTSLVFEGEDYDSLNEFTHTTGVFVANKYGVYLVNVSVGWGAMSAGWKSLYLLKNGTIIRRHGGPYTDSAQEVSTIVTLDVSDTLSAMVRQEGSGTTGVIGGTKWNTFLEIVKIH